MKNYLLKFYLLILFGSQISFAGFAQINNVSQLVDATGINNPGTSQGPLGYFYWNGNDTVMVCGTAQPGTIVQLGDGPFNLDDLEASGFFLPLIVPPGVVVQGTYDLLSEPAPGWQNTSPNGTLVYCNLHRSKHDATKSCPGIKSQSKMYMFMVSPGTSAAQPTTIRNMRIRGASLQWTDFNIGYTNNPVKEQDTLYCGGIVIPDPCKFDLITTCPVNGPYGYDYLITHCEIYGFNIAGVWVEARTDKITIDHCYMHHVKHNTIRGSGYNIWATLTTDASTWSAAGRNFVVANTIFDDAKNALDQTSGGANVFYEYNSETQFSGGINRHNNVFGFYPHPTSTNSCDFYHEIYGTYRNRDNPPDNYCKRQCEPADQCFGIDDMTFGNSTYKESVFQSSSISTQYPVKFGISKVIPPPSPLLLSPAGFNPTILANGNVVNTTYSISCPNNPNNPNSLPIYTNWDVSSIPQAGFFAAFNYLGGNYTNCFVSLMGIAKLGRNSSDYSGLCYANTPYDFPDDPKHTHGPHDIVALCWTELSLSTNSLIQCWYDNGNDIFVIEWNNVIYNGTLEHVTGQIIFNGSANTVHAGSIEIRLEHQDIAQHGSNYRLLGVIGAAGNSGDVPDNRNTFTKIPDVDCAFNDNFWTISTGEAFIMNPPVLYTVDVSHNTFRLPAVAPTSIETCETYTDSRQSNLRTGYAQISNNYIEACPWDGDQQIIHIGNSTGYREGTPVGSNCPQPPEQNLELTYAGGGSLPITTNPSITPGHSRMQFVEKNINFKVHITPGTQGSQQAAYIVRNNPCNGTLVQNAATNTQASNNYFFNETQVVNGNPDATATLAYSDAGLHGIDVLAVDAGNSAHGKKYFCSNWQHIPVVVPPENYHLIFNILDSYQEFHHRLAYFSNLQKFTGVYKQVELNGHPVWREDICNGGDGWERVDIDLSQQNLASLDVLQPIMLNYIRTDGKPNTISFSIYIDPNVQVPTNKVNGLLVTIDDVYLKKHDSPDNLIHGGDVENSKQTTGLDDHFTLDEPWYKLFAYSFPCNPASVMNDNGGVEYYYPDGSLMDRAMAIVGSAPARANITRSIRKSGAQAILLMLPSLEYGSSCLEYPHPAGSIAVSAATEFDFRGLLGCDKYSNTFPSGIITGSSNYGPSPTVATVYRLTSDLQVGDGTILTTLNCEGCVVAISPGIKITVKNNATLNLKRKSITDELAGLFACSDMWQGIVIEPGGTVMIDDSVIISDALTAIRCEGNGTDQGVPALHINSNIATGTTCVFDHNNIDIELINDNYDADFSCFPASFLCTDRFLPKNPMRGELAFAHIVTHEARNVEFGEHHTFDGHVKNALENAHYGIFAITSDITAWHTDFKNIALEDDAFEPSAIYSESKSIVNLNVGSVLQATTNRYLCNFINCGKGINVIGDIKTSVFNNTFKGIHNFGTIISNVATQTIDVVGNTLDSCADNIYLISNYTSQPVNITGNTITGGKDDTQNPVSDHGIAVYEPYPVLVNLTISQNTIADCGHSILAINANRAPNGNFNIDQNNIVFDFDENHLGSVKHRGIWLANCSGVKIALNNIIWNSGLTIPADINVHADNVQGLHLEKVQSSDIKDNIVTACGTGMFMMGDCRGTYLTCNTYNDNYPGMNFNNVKLPAQGSSCAPAGNTWNIASGNDKIDPQSSGISFAYYYDGPTAPANSMFPQPPVIGLINPIPINTCNPSNPCSNGSGSQLMADDTTKKDEELETIVDQPPSAPAEEFAEETEYNNKEYAYKTMQELPELINSSDRSEFMDSTVENNIGKFQEVKELILSGDSSLASFKNNLIIDTNLIEYNKKVVNNAYLNSPNDTLTPADSVIFDQIQHQLALQGGEAVFWTRGKMRSDIEDNYVSNQRRANQNQNNVPLEKLISIFPNPAQNSLSVIGLKGACEIEIYNAQGKLLSKNKTSDSSIQLSLAEISNGLYFLKVKNSSIRYFRTTFIVIK